MALSIRQRGCGRLDHPYRCQSHGSAGEGQCRFLSMEGLIREGLNDEWTLDEVKDVPYCPQHGAFRLKHHEKRRVHDYRLSIFQERVTEFAASDKVKDLRGEIGVLRMMVESIITRCENANDILMFSSRIAQLVGQLEKLVSTCTRAELKNGQMLDKGTALQFAGLVVSVVGKYVTDPVILDQLGEDLTQAFKEAIGDDEQSRTPVSTSTISYSE